MSRFAKFAWFTLGWAVLDILWGALVRATGSGAGCGNHWPTCNGVILPTPQHIGTLIEFTHRMLSGVILLLVLILFILGWLKFPKGSQVRIGVTGSGAFILSEAGLGAVLVLFHLVESNSSVLRAVVVALHLLNTFILLAFLALTAWWASGGKVVSLRGKGSLPYLFGIGLLGVALLGMTGAITALGDTLFPASSLAQGLAQDVESNAHFLVRLRVIHPFIAVLVAAYSLILARLIYRRIPERVNRRLSVLLACVILAQVTAGITNLLLLAPIWMQIIHLFLADSVWITLVLLSASSLSQPLETAVS